MERELVCFARYPELQGIASTVESQLAESDVFRIIRQSR